MTIGGILFIILAVIAAGMSGFLACLGALMGDPVVYNRLTASYWYGTLIGTIMSAEPRDTAVLAAFAAVACAGFGLALLV